MFGKKQKKIDELIRQRDQYQQAWEAEYNTRCNAEKNLSAELKSQYDAKVKLETAHEQIKDLAYENDDLNRKVDLLESVLKQLNIPVKLATRKASERAR